MHTSQPAMRCLVGRLPAPYSGGHPCLGRSERPRGGGKGTSLADSMTFARGEVLQGARQWDAWRQRPLSRSGYSSLPFPLGDLINIVVMFHHTFTLLHGYRIARKAVWCIGECTIPHKQVFGDEGFGFCFYPGGSKAVARLAIIQRLWGLPLANTPQETSLQQRYALG